jgi:hypothetical protein
MNPAFIFLEDVHTKNLDGQEQFDADNHNSIKETHSHPKIEGEAEIRKLGLENGKMLERDRHIRRQQRRFKMAQNITLRAESINAEREERWIELLKDTDGIFGRLVRLARSAEGMKTIRAKDAIEMIRV